MRDGTKFTFPHTTELSATALSLGWQQAQVAADASAPLSRQIQQIHRAVRGFSMLVFFAPAEHALLGDFNPQLIDTYRTVARAPHAVAAKLTTMLVSHEYYYELRAQNPAALRSVERAARFVYLNRFCFNGVFRTNQRGEFNVPRGTKTGQLPTATDLRACAQILRSATLIAGDFERTLEGVDRGDFVYLDPPYSSSAERNRGEYGYGAFSSDDLGRLEECLRKIDRLSGRQCRKPRHVRDCRSPPRTERPGIWSRARRCHRS